MTVSKFLAPSLGLSAIALAAALATTPASAAPVARGLSSIDSSGNQLLQEVRWRRHHHHHRHHRHGRGGAVAAGVLGGLALGAALGAAASAPPPPPAYYAPYGGRADWIAYCSSKYRSFDPATGTYLGYDGLRHPCR